MKADKKKMLFIWLCLIILISFLLAGITSCDASKKDKEVSDAKDVKVAAKVTDKQKEKSDASESSSRKSSPLKSEEKSSSSSGSSSGSSGSSKPSHQHSFTPHYATGYKTETQYVDKYVCNGVYFDDYDSGYAYYVELSEQGVSAHLRPVTVPQEVSVPYQYVDYYYCSCGARK